MFRQLFLCIFLLSFTHTCAKSTIKIMPDYANKKFGPQKLSVIHLNDDISIVNEDDLRDDLGVGNPEEIFKKLIESLFPDKLKKHYSKFQEVVLIDSIELANPRETSLSIGKERKIYITIPGDGEQVKIISLKPDVILFIDKFITFRHIQENAGWHDPNSGWVGGGSTSSLRYIMTFVLWDNREGKIVSQGEAVGDNSVFGAMTYKTWNKAFNEVARSILAKTPYYRPQTLAPPNSSLPNPLEKEKRMKPAVE